MFVNENKTNVFLSTFFFLLSFNCFSIDPPVVLMWKLIYGLLMLVSFFLKVKTATKKIVCCLFVLNINVRQIVWIICLRFPISVCCVFITNSWNYFYSRHILICTSLHVVAIVVGCLCCVCARLLKMANIWCDC